MLSKITSFLTLFKNIDKIRSILNTTYVAVAKTLSTLVFLESQINNTSLGKTLQKYLPTIIQVLEKVKEIFEQYGPIIGLSVGEAVAQSVLSEENFDKELKKTLADLNSL